MRHLVYVAFVHCIFFFTYGSHTLRLSQSHLSGLYIRCGTRASFSQNVVSSCQRNMIFVHKFAPWSSLKLKLFYAVSSISHVFCCSFSPWVTWLSIPLSLYYVLRNRVIWDLGPVFLLAGARKKSKQTYSLDLNAANGRKTGQRNCPPYCHSVIRSPRY